MLVKKIKYTDYNDVVREEEFRFNLNQAEIIEMELSTSGGLVEAITKIVNEQDGEKLVAIFKKIILKAYGVKSADGKRFEKSEELSIAFSQTEAYSLLFTELASDAGAAAAFVNGIIPQPKNDPPKS